MPDGETRLLLNVQNARACERASGCMNDKRSVFLIVCMVCVCVSVCMSRSASPAQSMSECVLGSKCIPDSVCVYARTHTRHAHCCEKYLQGTSFAYKTPLPCTRMFRDARGQQVNAFRILTLKEPMRRKEV